MRQSLKRRLERLEAIIPPIDEEAVRIIIDARSNADPDNIVTVEKRRLRLDDLRLSLRAAQKRGTYGR